MSAYYIILYIILSLFLSFYIVRKNTVRNGLEKRIASLKR